jgi:hypothetical protein
VCFELWGRTDEIDEISWVTCVDASSCCITSAVAMGVLLPAGLSGWRGREREMGEREGKSLCGMWGHSSPEPGGAQETKAA